MYFPLPSADISDLICLWSFALPRPRGGAILLGGCADFVTERQHCRLWIRAISDSGGHGLRIQPFERWSGMNRHNARTGSTDREMPDDVCKVDVGSLIFKQAGVSLIRLPVLGRRGSTCAVQSRRFSSGCESRPASFAPAGSNRSSHGGNEVAEAFGVEGH